VAKSQEDISTAPDPDLLAAVVLHVLVSEGRDGVSIDQVARACERDPGDTDERQEVLVALEILLRDELAHRADGEGAGALYLPTRAAVRAAELSF
jgi:hypothetical protein